MKKILCLFVILLITSCNFNQGLQKYGTQKFDEKVWESDINTRCSMVFSFFKENVNELNKLKNYNELEKYITDKLGNPDEKLTAEFGNKLLYNVICNGKNKILYVKKDKKIEIKVWNYGDFF